MAITLGNHTSAGCGGSGIGPFTTPAINTTGASLLVVGVAYYNATSNVMTITDSLSNTWVRLTRSVTGTENCELWYCKNPTVGGSHTVTATTVTNSDYSAVTFAAFNGVDAVSPFDIENGVNGSGASITALAITGSATPSQANELEVAVLGLGAGYTSTAVASGYSLIESQTAAPNYQVTLVYKIQTAAAAPNPSWTWTGGVTSSASRVATFKAAAGAAASNSEMFAFFFS